MKKEMLLKDMREEVLIKIVNSNDHCNCTDCKYQGVARLTCDEREEFSGSGNSSSTMIYLMKTELKRRLQR